MAKKKYKVMFGGLEVSSTDIYDFRDFENLLHKAAIYERGLGHLKNCQEYEQMADNILKEIGEQI